MLFTSCLKNSKLEMYLKRPYQCEARKVETVFSKLSFDPTKIEYKPYKEVKRQPVGSKPDGLFSYYILSGMR